MIDDEQLKDLAFYKAVATTFANELLIPQSVKDSVIMRAIQQVNQDARPDELNDTQVLSAITGETSRGMAAKLENFRLFLVDKKTEGSELLNLYEKLDESKDKNSNPEVKLYKLIHWAIAKAEGIYLTNEDAVLEFDSDYILPYLCKLSRSKKVKVSSTLVAGTYYDDEFSDGFYINITQKEHFTTIESLDKFIKKQKTPIAVSSVHKAKGGIFIDYQQFPSNANIS